MLFFAFVVMKKINFAMNNSLLKSQYYENTPFIIRNGCSLCYDSL